MPQKYLTIVSFVVCCCLCQSAWAAELTLRCRLLDAISYVDSGGDICALGGVGGSLELGAYQITRQHYQEAIVGDRTLSAFSQGKWLRGVCV